MSKVIWGKIIIIFIFCIGSLTSTYFIMKVMKETNIEIKNNKETIKSKDAEIASVTEIYIDENNKTIYIVAIGGN